MIVLVGTGWSYMTPFLRDREKRILMVVIPLQVICFPNKHKAWAESGAAHACEQ